MFYLYVFVSLFEILNLFIHYFFCIQVLYYNTKHDQPLKKLDFVKRGIKMVRPRCQEGPRGANTDKVEKIKQEMLPFMTAAKRKWWEQVPCNRESDDILDRPGIN